MNKFNKDANLLIGIDLIYTFIGIFANTFMVAYLLKITGSNIAKISMYYMIIYSLSGIGNVIVGKLIKKHANNCNSIMLIGIVSKALFVLMIAILKEKISNLYILIGILYSISEVAYWVAHEVIYIEVTKNDNRKKYMSMKKLLSKLVSVVAPIILGTSIELYSFTKIAIYVFIFAIIQIVLALLIKTDISVENREYSYKGF